MKIAHDDGRVLIKINYIEASELVRRPPNDISRSWSIASFENISDRIMSFNEHALFDALAIDIKT